MNKRVLLSILAVVALLVLHPVREIPVQAQAINGVPNQVMSGFTNVSVSTMAIGGATPP